VTKCYHGVKTSETIEFHQNLSNLWLFFLLSGIRLSFALLACD
jgi:hypothetical protein